MYGEQLQRGMLALLQLRHKGEQCTFWDVKSAETLLEKMKTRGTYGSAYGELELSEHAELSQKDIIYIMSPWRDAVGGPRNTVPEHWYNISFWKVQSVMWLLMLLPVLERPQTGSARSGLFLLQGSWQALRICLRHTVSSGFESRLKELNPPPIYTKTRACFQDPTGVEGPILSQVRT